MKNCVDWFVKPTQEIGNKKHNLLNEFEMKWKRISESEEKEVQETRDSWFQEVQLDQQVKNLCYLNRTFRRADHGAINLNVKQSQPAFVPKFLQKLVIVIHVCPSFTIKIPELFWVEIVVFPYTNENFTSTEYYFVKIIDFYTF